MPKLIISVEESHPEVFEADTLMLAFAQVLSVGAEVNPEGCDYDLPELLSAMAEFAEAVRSNDGEPTVLKTSINFDSIKFAWGCENWDRAEVLFEAE